MHCISLLTSAGCLKIGRLIFGEACNQQFQLKHSTKNRFVRGGCFLGLSGGVCKCMLLWELPPSGVPQLCMVPRNSTGFRETSFSRRLLLAPVFCAGNQGRMLGTGVRVPAHPSGMSYLAWCFITCLLAIVLCFALRYVFVLSLRVVAVFFRGCCVVR